MTTNITEAARVASVMRRDSGFKKINVSNIKKVRDDIMFVYVYSEGDVLVSAFGCKNNSTVKVKVSCY